MPIAIAIVIAIAYYLGIVVTERMNKDLRSFDPAFPIIGLAWIFWPFTIFAFFLFYFLIPGPERAKGTLARFVQWYNKRP